MVFELTDVSLLQSGAFIDGKVCESISGSRVDVIDPATSKIIGSVPEMNGEDSRIAIAAAEKIVENSLDEKTHSELINKVLDSSLKEN